jgi:hypothetical protein
MLRTIFVTVLTTLVLSSAGGLSWADEAQDLKALRELGGEAVSRSPDSQNEHECIHFLGNPKLSDEDLKNAVSHLKNSCLETR